VDVVFVAAGACAFHSAVIDAQGRVYTWGRNEARLVCRAASPAALTAVQSGQLGHGDRATRNVPALVQGLDGMKAVHVACGKARAAAVPLPSC
jgi:alpha-tubulin suppressor-like RCC1 family protein